MLSSGIRALLTYISLNTVWETEPLSETVSSLSCSFLFLDRLFNGILWWSNLELFGRKLSLSSLKSKSIAVWSTLGGIKLQKSENISSDLSDKDDKTNMDQELLDPCLELCGEFNHYTLFSPLCLFLCFVLYCFSVKYFRFHIT